MKIPRKLGSIALAGAVLLTAVFPVARANADTPAPAATAARAQQTAADQPEITLTPANSQVLPGDDVKFSLSLLNNSGTTLQSGKVAIYFNADPVASPASLQLSLNSNAAKVAELETPKIQPAQNWQTEITIASTQLPAPIAASAADHKAIYMFQAVYGQNSKTPNFSLPETSAALTINDRSTTAITYGAGSIEKTKIGVIVPLLLPEQVETIPSKTEVAELFRAESVLSRTLTKAEEVGATLAIDPLLLVSLRGYGTDTPQAATDFLARLESTALPSFLLQPADADLGLQAQLGLSDPLQPGGLSPLTAPHYAGLQQDILPRGEYNFLTPPPQPLPQADEMPAAEIPPLSELTSWHSTAAATGKAVDSAAPANDQSASAWLEPDTTNAQTLKFLATHSIKNIYVSSDSIAATEAGSTGGITPAQLANFNVTIINAPLTAAVRDAVSESAHIREHGLKQIAAHLSLLSGSDRTSVISLPRINRNNNTGLQILDSLTKFDGVEFAKANIRSDSTGAENVLTPDLIGNAQTVYLPLSKSTQAITASRVTAFKTALTDTTEIVKNKVLTKNPDYLPDYQQLRLLHLSSAKYAADTDFNAVADHFKKHSEKLKTAVNVITAEQTQLFGSSANLPIQIQNELPFAVRVRVKTGVNSPAIVLGEPDLGERYIRRGQMITAILPVKSRISSAVANVEVYITDSTEKNFVKKSVVKIIVSSAVERIVIFLLSLSAIILLIFGLVRSIKKNKANHRDSGSTATQEHNKN